MLKEEFLFHNLQKIPYKLFSLKDMNGDFLYNLKTEKIGFCDSIVNASYAKPAVTDTLEKKDSLIKKSPPENKDTLVKKDTVRGILLPDIPVHSIRLFQEIDSTQKLLRSDLIQDKEVRLIFKFPTRKPQFIPMNFSPEGKWEITEFNKTRDTLYLWLTDVAKDSLIMKISDAGSKTDTATIDLTTKSKKRSTAKKGKPEVITFSLNTAGNRLNQFRNDLEITSSYPLKHVNFSGILLISGKDTVKPKVSFYDSVRRIFIIKEKWKEDLAYKVIIPDSALFSINGLTNDSLVSEFKARSQRDFGTLKVDVGMDQTAGFYIIQLLNEKENILEERYLTKAGKLEFDYLFPGKYKLKAILDRNHNRRWDTGVYFEHIQPEEVFYFPKTIEVRSNWDIDETWSL